MFSLETEAFRKSLQQLELFMSIHVFQQICAKSRFSKSASHFEIYYSRITPIISHLLIINTMLPTH
jgi:hypothetical protein